MPSADQFSDSIIGPFGPGPDPAKATDQLHRVTLSAPTAHRTVQISSDGKIMTSAAGDYAGQRRRSMTSSTNVSAMSKPRRTPGAVRQYNPAEAFALDPDNTLELRPDSTTSPRTVSGSKILSSIQLAEGSLRRHTCAPMLQSLLRRAVDKGTYQAQISPPPMDPSLAGAPAFDWDRFVPSELSGPAYVMNSISMPISRPKLQRRFSDAAVHGVRHAQQRPEATT